MCGICGIVDNSAKAFINEERLRRMCGAMRHRGPDDEGVYIDKAHNPSVGLGHRRLSIIDLSAAGHQPMANESGTVWIACNGEVYNYKELKAGLESKGHLFRSNTDTETILHLYEEYGKKCVKYLRGMFAFAIWDVKERILLLARDRVGKKPLVYYHRNGNFCFASEFTGLLASGLIEKKINHKAIDYYLTFGYIPAPLTIYEDVVKLEPAHLLILKDNKITTERYWQLDYSPKMRISEDEAQDETLGQLKEAIRIRLHSDVPLGAFLSGGIDSSAVVALMSELAPSKVKTFSIGFEESDYSELKYAKNIAKRFSTEHNEFIVRPKALEILPLLVERYGEPYADSSCIPSYYVAQQTKRFVTVALNGDGGDESFAGYERYQAMLIAQGLPEFSKIVFNRLAGLAADSIDSKSRIRRIKRFFNAAILPASQRYTKWVGIFDEEAKRGIYSDTFRVIVSTSGANNYLDYFLSGFGKDYSVDHLLKTDIMTYLPGDLLVKMDIAAMANSLEARSPFLDHKLMEFAAKLPAKYKIKMLTKKYILKKAIKDLVPYENIHRRKMGFGIPVGEWFRGELKSFLCDSLLSDSFSKRGYFRPAIVKEMVSKHNERKADYSFQLWALLMLELWHQRFID